MYSIIVQKRDGVDAKLTREDKLEAMALAAQVATTGLVIAEEGCLVLYPKEVIHMVRVQAEEGAEPITDEDVKKIMQPDPGKSLAEEILGHAIKGFEGGLGPNDKLR